MGWQRETGEREHFFRGGIIIDETTEEGGVGGGRLALGKVEVLDLLDTSDMDIMYI
jgi:hypothetical protein